jgi:hypothetical protein
MIVSLPGPLYPTHDGNLPEVEKCGKGVDRVRSANLLCREEEG